MIATLVTGDVALVALALLLAMLTRRIAFRMTSVLTSTAQVAVQGMQDNFLLSTL